MWYRMLFQPGCFNHLFNLNIHKSGFGAQTGPADFLQKSKSSPLQTKESSEGENYPPANYHIAFWKHSWRWFSLFPRWDILVCWRVFTFNNRGWKVKQVRFLLIFPATLNPPAGDCSPSSTYHHLHLGSTRWGRGAFTCWSWVGWNVKFQQAEGWTCWNIHFSYPPKIQQTSPKIGRIPKTK